MRPEHCTSLWPLCWNETPIKECQIFVGPGPGVGLKLSKTWDACSSCLHHLIPSTSNAKLQTLISNQSNSPNQFSNGLRDAFPFQNGWIFGKVPKGGGMVIFNPKIYIAKFGPLSRAIWPWNWYKGVFSGYVFQQIYSGYFPKTKSCATLVT